MNYARILKALEEPLKERSRKTGHDIINIAADWSKTKNTEDFVMKLTALLLNLTADTAITTINAVNIDRSWAAARAGPEEDIGGDDGDGEHFDPNRDRKLS